MKHLKLFFALFAMLALGVGNAWGAEYELIATLDCAKASSEGTTALYGSSTSSMSADKVKAYINAAAGKTLISSNPTISGSIYWRKGSGGGEIPDNVFKLGKASGPGSVQFTIDGTDNVVKVVIVGHGWKTSSSISVNSADAQNPSAQYTEQTFVFDNLSPTKDITISVTSSAVCITSIQLYKEASGGGETPEPTPTQLAAPTGLTVGNITSSGATLSWNAVDNASSYVVTIVDGGSLNNDYPVTGITTTVSDLESSTDYLWTVTAVGDGINYTNSEESETGEFTTSAPAGGGEGDGEETWTLVTDASTLKADDEIIIAASGDNNYALSTNQKSSNRAGTAITKSGNTLVEPSADVQILTLKAGSTSGTFAFYTGTSGYLYAASSSANQLKTKTTLDVHGSWTISITDGVASIVAEGSSNRNVMQYNYNGGDPLFNCYSTATQKALAIYKKVTSSGGSDPEPVIVKTLESIEVTGMTTTFEQGDVFKFDGTCTATYSVTKDGVAQADETAEVTPASVSAPDMNQIGTQTVYVTYSEGGVEKTDDYEITITENTVTAGEYCITPNNDFWGTNFNGSLSGDALGQTYTGRQDDITIQYAKGSGSNLYINDSQTRTYNGTTLTFSVPSGYLITAIAFTADGTNWKGTHTANVGSMTDSQNWAGLANEVTITFGDKCYITNICVTYEAIDLTLPSAPTFNPEAGTYNAVQNVIISAEAGTTIYYTLDGTDPTTASDVYASAIEIAETKTLKAIAVKDEKVSPIASATYTIKLPLTTMDQIFAKATEVGSTPTSVEITFGNWVVSAVKEDGKTAFVTDGTKGFVIFDKDVNLGFSVGNILSGTATCKVQLYNGFAELTELKSNTVGLSVGSGGTITTQELDATAIEALTGVNTGSLIKINGICTQSGSNYYVAGVQLYSSLYAFGTLEVGAEYNITGIYQQFHSTKEILPRSAADVEEVVGLPTATIEVSNITMEVGQEKDIEATITPVAAQSTVKYSITAGNEFITLNGTTITAIAVGTATITATIAEVAGVYNGATKTFTVSVKPQNIAILPFTFNGGKADIENTLGMSQTGLDDDYGSAPKLKFNSAGDNVIVHFDSQAGEFSFLLKQNGSNAGTFTVYESANGEDYTSVWSGGDFGNAQSETIKPTLSESARYVKFEYTTKGTNTNYALGSISIAKPDFRQEAGLAWSVESVILNQGDEFTAPTLSNDNGLTLTCSSTDESVATVTSEGVITLAGAIGTTTITASFAGNEYYKAAEVSCKITVNKAQLPTGTFALYSGDIVEGDYVITYENYAMNTTSSAAPRLQYQEVAPTENKLVNPANQIVWHIAADGEYWTLYNNYDEVYAVSTGVKNQATTAAEVTDNAKWSITGPKMFDFENYERANSATDNENKYLRKNNEYGFACYKNSTGGALTLYRKQTQHTVTVATCTNGSVSASVENGATVLSGEIITLSNTPDAGYLLTEYNVYKTGDETVKVTVTDGTFMMPAFDVTISAIFATITLGDGDNSAVIAANDGSVVNVQLNRSFTEGVGYYTLCVPFNMPASTIGTAYTLGAITKHVSGEEGGININLTKVDNIEAGVPYLVLPKTLTNPVFENVTINNIDPATKAISTSGAGVKVTFTGIINGGGDTNGTTEYYVGDNGYLYNGTVAKLGLRAFFTITDEAGNPTPIRARVVANENVETGVEDIITTDTPAKVIENGQLIIIRDGVKYNVQGVRL